METLREIIHSIRQNKVRSFMSGFGIMWGIFILVLLLGVGKGVEYGVQNQLKSFASKSIFVWGGETSMKYKNMQEGRRIFFNKYLLEDIKRRFPEIEGLSPRISVSKNIIFGKRNYYTSVTGITHDYWMFSNFRMIEGSRPFNLMDDKKVRNVAIIGKKVATKLFLNDNPLDKLINVGGVYYRVIGVMKNDDMMSQRVESDIFVPFPSFTCNIQDAPDISTFALYLRDDAQISIPDFKKKITNYLARTLRFDENDPNAVYVHAFEEEISSVNSIFTGISVFIWIVGLCFLISGIVSVTNILFIVVKERTNEFGLRMAIGATPRHIIIQVLLEALIITLASGLMGMFLGIGVLKLVNMFLTATGGLGLLKTTEIDMGIASLAVFIMVLSGIFAGTFPARKASKIEPVAAMRYENRG
ncbi:efflux ABC transporter, permease protein [Capnocytophaga gingivalis ATCC 33624]|uniref:ABC transporter permease n=1 Tax=Capnocytophaga gingivalis TaxID=1017 RepID=UPI00019FBFC1|nr:ABC transporter permease [Capnocytophaga gingivalis]EEK14984.1 efflux ABC transporter, permease protein [Capnocytophaga gingivalis ATCC 33624]